MPSVITLKKLLLFLVLFALDEETEDLAYCLISLNKGIQVFTFLLMCLFIFSSVSSQDLLLKTPSRGSQVRRRLTMRRKHNCGWTLL